MRTRNIRLALLVGLLMIFAPLLEVSSSAQNRSRNGKSTQTKKKEESATPVLWRNPGNIRSRDLFYGPGSKALAPVPPFRFLTEDKSGASPKFEVKDARNVRWRVKLGEEAQSETVVSRLVWAMGYNAEESYYYDRVQINGLPRLSRGHNFIRGDQVLGARFEPRRDNVKRGKNWGWGGTPFKGTREMEGLELMMALVNNWDVKPKNNRILYVRNPKTNRVEALYTVTDLGASLGYTGAVMGRHRSKNDVQDFERSRFVRKVDKGTVKLDYDVRPSRFFYISVFYPPYFIRRMREYKVIHKVPVEDAAWIGAQLAQLSDDQLRDTFRAAGYDQQTIERYVRALRKRINELSQLRREVATGKSRRNG